MKIKLQNGFYHSIVGKSVLLILSLFAIGQVWGQTFTENMGTSTSTTNTSIANTTFQNSGTLSYVGNSDTRFNSNVNSTGYVGASGGRHVFITNNANQYFTVFNINTSNLTNLKLTFGIWKNTGNSTPLTSSQFTVEVSTNYNATNNTGTFTALTFANVTTGSVWSLLSPTGTIPSSSTLAIRFRQITTTHQVRIDDLTLTGNSACSAPTISSTTSVANNTATGIDLSGSVTAIGGANVSEVGFNYGTAADLAGFSTSASTGLSVSATPYGISRTLSGLTANTQYYYRAYAINSCTAPQTSYSHASGYPTFTTVSLAPVSAAPDNIVMNSFRANWIAPTGQGSVSYTYHLQISEDNLFGSTIYDNENLSSLNHTQNSLTAGETYYYRVRVKNTGGYSEWSSVQNATTASSNKPVVVAATFTGSVNNNFSRGISATNLPDSYAIFAGSNLPAGLSLNTSTGLITGIPTEAGTFTTQVTATKGAETSDPATLTFEIGKGSQTITGLEATIAKVYGDTSYQLSATATSELAVTYSSSNTSVATITGNVVEVIGAGTSTITAIQAGDNNWNAAQDTTQILTVSPKELTITGITAENKIYDQNTSVAITGAPTYSGLVNEESFSVTGVVSWAFENKIAQTNKNLVRTGNYDAPSGNYTVVQPILQASILKKEIAITNIVALNKTYNGTSTASFSGISSNDILSGDNVTFTVGGNFADANAGENKMVTVLSIALGGTDGLNYNIPIFPTGLSATIFKADQTIILTTIPSLNVGDVINLNNYATTSSNLPLQFSSSIPAIASISGSDLTGNNMGSTTITISQQGDINYSPAESVQQIVDVVELPVPLAQWDFYGLNSSATATTVTAQVKNSAITAESAVLARGLGAPWSSASNSFRTQGFRNDGISLANTDYFTTSFTATQRLLSVTSVKAAFNGTASFIANPGVQVQFAYSFNDLDYTFINSPTTVVNTNQTVNINLAGIPTLQDLPVGTTVYFRFYASGQTTTGGYGFFSSEPGNYGLEFIGRLKIPTITWDGAAWSNINGPDGSQNAIIDGPYIQSSDTDALEINDLSITENGSLTIQSDQGITVNGNISTPDDKIIIESGGSLVQTKLDNANNDNVVIARRSVTMRTSDYTYWSSPVEGQILRNTTNGNASNSSGGFSPGSPNNRTYEYNEVNDTFRATPDALFRPAKGYAIRGKSGYGTGLTSDQLTFRGGLNNGDYEIQIQKSKNTLVNGVPTEHGYNLIGNPYPSHIDFYRFYNLDRGDGSKNSDLITGAAWFWTNVPGAPVTQGGSAYSANNYATLNLSGGAPATGSDEFESPEPNQFIKVSQGFIIQMRTPAPTGNTPDVGTLKFDNSIRTNNSTGSFYNSKADGPVNRYRLRLISPYNVVNTILLAHIDGATNDYDPDYDTELFSIGDDSFFSMLNAKRLQIQARNNPLVDTDVIGLGTKYSTDGTYRINLGKKEGIFANGQKIYLKDNLTNTFTDLSTQDYSFSATKGFDEGRFEIVYKNNEVLGTSSPDKSNFTVYKDVSYYVVTSTEKLGRVEVYDGLGRLVLSKKSENTSIRLDASNFINGIYIIKADNGGNVKTKKIIK